MLFIKREKQETSGELYEILSHFCKISWKARRKLLSAENRRKVLNKWTAHC